MKDIEFIQVKLEDFRTELLELLDEFKYKMMTEALRLKIYHKLNSYLIGFYSEFSEWIDFETRFHHLSGELIVSFKATEECPDWFKKELKIGGFIWN